jgi:outer membrane protein OmpA-like peptidoglycan-associated protein
MWIVKLNRDASMAQISSNVGTFYERLTALYKDEILKKEIVIKKDLTIEFIDKRLYFKAGVYKLTKTQKIYLSKFSKKLLEFLYANKNLIETLEVDGHTSSEWGESNFTHRYLNNEKLSLNRSYEVMSSIFTPSSKKIKLWLSNILKGSGDSYSKSIKYNGIESKKKSRRVSFKIILK